MLWGLGEDLYISMEREEGVEEAGRGWGTYTALVKAPALEGAEGWACPTLCPAYRGRGQSPAPTRRCAVWS